MTRRALAPSKASTIWHYWQAGVLSVHPAGLPLVSFGRNDEAEYLEELCKFKAAQALGQGFSKGSQPGSLIKAVWKVQVQFYQGESMKSGRNTMKAKWSKHYEELDQYVEKQNRPFFELEVCWRDIETKGEWMHIPNCSFSWQLTKSQWHHHTIKEISTYNSESTLQGLPQDFVSSLPSDSVEIWPEYWTTALENNLRKIQQTLPRNRQSLLQRACTQFRSLPLGQEV